MALKKIKTEKTKHRKLTWYFNCSAYVELLLHTWFIVVDGRSGGHTASQISTTCLYGSNLKHNQWQLWYIDTPIDNVITWLMRNIHTKSKLVNSMMSAISFTNQGISLGVSLNFTTCQEVEKIEVPDFFLNKTWSVNYKQHWEVEVCACAVTSDCHLQGAKTFLRKFW